MLQLLPLTKWFFLQILIIHDNLSSQVDDKRSGFGQWMNSSILHDNISSLTHKKCHPKSTRGDIKYHMKMNIVFIVVYGTVGAGTLERKKKKRKKSGGGTS